MFISDRAHGKARHELQTMYKKIEHRPRARASLSKCTVRNSGVLWELGTFKIYSMTRAHNPLGLFRAIHHKFCRRKWMLHSSTHAAQQQLIVIGVFASLSCCLEHHVRLKPLKYQWVADINGKSLMRCVRKLRSAEIE